ncbi:MAG: hypothetical protein Q4A11_03720 [Brachymonas sp.]|nr:hypothetical protein [Brachymonas sp.]
MPRSICKIAQLKCGYIKEWMGSCDRVKEESITDWLLYELSKSSSRIINIPFTRYVEGKLTGADWEWWILYPSRAIRLRIQAKKLSQKNINREMRKRGTNGYQMMMLINDSVSPRLYPNIPALPLYVFYTDDSPPNTVCKGIDRGGAYLASANALYNYFFPTYYRSGVSIKNFPVPLFPLSSLFCCPKIFGCFDNFRFQGVDSDLVGMILDEFYRCFINIENVPDKIIQIASSSAKPKWFELESEEYKRLMIFDLRMEGDRNV